MKIFQESCGMRTQAGITFLFSGGGEQSKYIYVANKDKTKTCM